MTTYTYHPKLKIPTSVENPLHLTTSTQYDGQGNAVALTDSSGAVTELTRDAAGNVTARKDANGKTTLYEYDAFNRLVKVTSPKLEVTEYSYKPTGELTQVKDPLGNLHLYVYNQLGQLESKTDPLGATSAYTYDPAGNLTSEIDPENHIHEFSYNAMNRLTQKKLTREGASSPEEVIDLAYDTRGNLAAVENNVSRIQRAFDPSGRMLSEQVLGKNALALYPSSVLYSVYDPQGRRTRMHTDGQGPGLDFAFTYNMQDHLTQVTNSLGESFAYSRDAVGRPTRLTRSFTPVVTNFAWVASGVSAGRLESITHALGGSTLAQVVYAFDPAGRITGRTTQIGAHAYGYDDNSQLAAVTNPEAPAAESFQYDAIGNRISDSGGSYTYDAKKQRLVEDYNAFYFYDAKGNLVTKQQKQAGGGLSGEVTQFRYSIENQLTSIEYYAAGEATPYKRVEYFYDAVGRRLEKRVADSHNPGDLHKTFRRKYVYDGQEIAAEYDGSNNLLATYTHSSERTDDVLSVRVTASGVAAGIATVVGSFAYIKDALGSVTDIVDSTGARMQRFVYSSFGQLMSIRDALGADVTAAPPVWTPFAFTGREFDSESGIYYYRARYYLAEIGRFLQRDPDPGTATLPATVTNGYSYVANNPITLKDSTGKNFWDALWNTVKFAGVVLIAPMAILFDPAWTTGQLMKTFNLSLAGQLWNKVLTGNWASEGSFQGRTTVENSMFSFGHGFNMGSVSFLPSGATNRLRYHEIGHQLQYERDGGWSYLIRGIGAQVHEKFVKGPNDSSARFECEAGELSRAKFGLSYYPDGEPNENYVGYDCVR